MILHGSGGDITAASTSITKNSDTSYTAIIIPDADIEVNVTFNFTFSSDTQGKFNMIIEYEDGKPIPSDYIDITKKE